MSPGTPSYTATPPTTAVAVYGRFSTATLHIQSLVYLLYPFNRSRTNPAVLSLTLSTAVTTITTDDSYFLTTSADEIIAQHPLEGTEPLQTVDTRRTGHQSVRLRGDGKLFATAGWDNRLRVYSAKTMNELAVLQWHRAGCYAIDFGEWLEGKEGEGSGRESGATGKGKGKGKEKELVGRLGDGGTVVTAAMARERKTRLRHWIAGGSKDSKVSLWEVY